MSPECVRAYVYYYMTIGGARKYVKMKIIAEARIFRLRESKRVSKNCGMVLDCRCYVMILVRRPSTAQAIKDPMRALPMPAQVAAMPYFQPNWPA